MEQATAHTLYCNSIVYLYYHVGVGQTKLVPRMRLLKICRNALYPIHSFRCVCCVVLRFCCPNVIIRLYLISLPVFISPAVLIYLRLYLYIFGCTYISSAVLTYLRLYLHISGCTYISPAVLIYLRLYLHISGCTYISPVVLIYLRLYLYIFGCTYISSAVLTYRRIGSINTGRSI